MKTYKILIVLSIVFGALYYELDRELFYYGKNDLEVYDLLPLHIIPEYTPKFEYGFMLRDQFGFSIAAKGNAYRVNNNNVVINKVEKYGFNKHQLVAVVVDWSNSKYYINFSKLNADSTLDVAMYLANKPNGFALDKWVNIEGNDEYIYRIVLIRNYVMFAEVILLITLFYKLFDLRRVSLKKQG